MCVWLQAGALFMYVGRGEELGAERGVMIDVY
jgi:hypothetical protein